MEASAFRIYFSRGPRLAENERYWPWDVVCWGTVRFEKDAIQLNGKHKVGVILGVIRFLMTVGPLQPLYRRLFAKNLTEVIPIPDLVRVEINQRPGKKTAFFKLYQKRDDGTVAVHQFVTGVLVRKNEPTSADAIASLMAIVPSSIVTLDGSEQGVAIPAPPAPLGTGGIPAPGIGAMPYNPKLATNIPAPAYSTPGATIGPGVTSDSPFQGGVIGGASGKSKVAAGILGIFFGGFGIHNFYLGYTKKAVAQIAVTFFTMGLGAVWGFVEGILILTGSINEDAQGLPLK